MPGWYESLIERQIREAQERGEFDNLPGAGKPLPGRGEPYDENWWIKDLVRREELAGVAPTSLRIRKEVEELMDTVTRHARRERRTPDGDRAQRAHRASPARAGGRTAGRTEHRGRRAGGTGMAPAAGRRPPGG